MQLAKSETNVRGIMHCLVVVIWLRTKLSDLGILDKSLTELASQFTEMSLFSVTKSYEGVKNPKYPRDLIRGSSNGDLDIPQGTFKNH